MARLTAVVLPCFLAFVSAPHARADDIERGLYLRTSYFGGNLSLSTLYIGAGNKIAVDPANGVDPFDFDAAAKAAPKTVGTYQLAGNRLTVTWSDGSTFKPEVEFEKGKLTAYDGGLVTKAEAFKKDQTLNHTYSGTGGTTNVVYVMTIQFADNGSYTLTRQSGLRRAPGADGQLAESTTKGTYKLSGNTLTLTPAGGKAIKHTVMPFSTALDPQKAKVSDDHLIFDGGKLIREK